MYSPRNSLKKMLFTQLFNIKKDENGGGNNHFLDKRFA